MHAMKDIDRTEQALVRHLRRHLADTPGTLVTGFSGGLDSSVLLYLLCHAGFRHRLQAVHVHHGLQPEADRWAEHCRRLARARQISFHCEFLALEPGAGLEARARAARRQALLARVPADGALLLAHHADDQAETLLFRLLRGAGPRGLAAMAERRTEQERTILRPLLGESRAMLEKLARVRGLDWVEDPSNRETGPDRNFLRHRVLPLLTERWPGAVDTLARDAALQRDAVVLLDEIRDQDLARIENEDGTLDLAGLTALSPPRRRNLLHGWLHLRGRRSPPRAVLERVERELLPAAPDRAPVIAWPEGTFRRHGNRLYLLDAAEREVPLPGEEALLLEDGTSRVWGCFRIRVKKLSTPEAPGPSGLCLPGDLSHLELVPPRGGERLLLGGMHRQLTECWRQAGIPPWRRPALPLLCLDGELVAAFAAGVADPWRPATNAPVWYLWLEPDPVTFR